LKLQKATMCGLYATLELAAHSGGQLSAAEIAAKYGISLNHLAKVLRALVRARLVESVRGASGGYRFCGNPKRVTLLDIIELFEDIREDEPHPKRTDPAEKRTLDGVLEEISEITVTSLRSVSITTLLTLIEKQERAVRAKAGSALRPKAVAAGE
jgi:Rrf2 family transcriptional regulator, iron-sulfur cluster assembly transcription factor